MPDLRGPLFIASRREVYFMRIVQLIIQKLLAAAIMASGVYIVAQEMGYWNDRMPLATPENPFAAYAVGVAFVLLGLIAVLPSLRFPRKLSTISFPGEHGDVLIHLDSVQANLNKVIGKRAEVKRGHVKVIPVADKRRVRLEADVLLIKTPDSGARELAEKLRKFIATTAANMLGIDEVTTVDLNVRGIVVDRGAVKAMATTEADVRPAQAIPEAVRFQESLPSAVRREAPAQPAAAEMDKTREAPRTAVAETEAKPADDGLASLPGWNEPDAPPPDDVTTQSDIVTPLLEDGHDRPQAPSDSTPAADDEPRDTTLFP